MESEFPVQTGHVDAIMFMLRVNFGGRLPWISAVKSNVKLVCFSFSLFVFRYSLFVFRYSLFAFRFSF